MNNLHWGAKTANSRTCLQSIYFDQSRFLLCAIRCHLCVVSSLQSIFWKFVLWKNKLWKINWQMSEAALHSLYCFWLVRLPKWFHLCHSDQAGKLWQSEQQLRNADFEGNHYFWKMYLGQFLCKDKYIAFHLQGYKPSLSSRLIGSGPPF